MAMIGVLIIGITMFFIMIVCISIIVIILSIVISLSSILVISLLKNKSNKLIIGIKAFIVAISGITSASFGAILFYTLKSINILKIDHNLPIFYIIISIIGFIIGIICALLVNKFIVNPIINLIKKLKDYKK